MAFSLLPKFLCFLSLLPFLALAQNTTNSISLDRSFSASNTNTPWVVSPSGDFAFGFQAVDDVFFLSIWYDKIPEKTIVWYADQDKPAPKGSKVQLTADRGLLLTSPDGEELWKPDTLIGTVSNGVLNDAGNLILQDAKSGSLWETFKNPRDTILPTQILEKGVKLNSRLSEKNLSKGRFELVLRQDGNLVFRSINLPSGYFNDDEHYYESKTVESNTSSPGDQLVFNKSGSLYILRENNERFNILSSGTVSLSDYYLRATLDFNGVFALYQRSRRSSSTEGWTPLGSLPDNICTSSTISAGIGVCGYNSICTLSADKRPICQCPRDYSLLDPSDPNGSCKADFIQGCEEDRLSQSKDLYEFVELTNTDWPLSDSVLQKPFTEEQCRQSCMEDCLCAVAIFRLGDSCWKKKLPLSNGRVDSSLNGGKAFIKVRKDHLSLSGPPVVIKKSQNTLILVISVLLGGSAFLNFILIGAICLSFSLVFKYRKNLKKMNRNGNTVDTNLRCFSYKELEEATNGFKEELGRGAFGIVYKGDLGIGSTCLVAVKKLHTFLVQDIEREFRNEVKVIGQTHHKNLVRLLGFCEDGAERLLVYEHMSNGTLANLLFSDSRPSWNLRLRIAFGIARGLLYLHEECSIQIIHCDIKPQNILLDDYYNARISDFGLAKLLNMNQSRTNTGIRGTKGYVALEWFKNMPITAKVDVYSFGVLLLEIISCRKSVNVESDNEEEAILTDWAYDCYKDGTLGALVQNDREALNDRKNLEKLVMVAIWCIQEDPASRPTMRKVTQMLEGVLEVPDPPCPSQFSVTQDLFLSVNACVDDQV